MKASPSNMVAEQNKDEYPVTVKDWFSRNRLHKFNYEALRSIVGQGSYKKVLDWGCGNLLWSLGLFPLAEITGVELSEETLGYAKKNARKNAVKFHALLNTEVGNLKSDYDAALTMGLIELITPEQFTEIFSMIFRSLKPGGMLICTLHNWRLFSALYMPWIVRGCYEGYVKRIGIRVSKKSLKDVELDFINLGYQVEKSGAYNPYPAKLWSLMPNIAYVTYNKLLAHWYCSQFILLRKPML
jgi:cyclopropane fatty-acyl-phospholipid synthase-like methyltransferase